MIADFKFHGPLNLTGGMSEFTFERQLQRMMDTSGKQFSFSYKMAGTAFYTSGLSSSSNLGACWLVLKTHNARALPGKLPGTGMRRLAIRAEVAFVNADKAKELVEVDGYAVLDVRDKYQFERAHIKSCTHVPLFIENKDNDPGTIIKRQLHNNFSGLFFGLPFTKPNPDFVQSVKTQFPPESKLLVVCQEGLRSAAAADKLEKAGYENIAYITSGLQTVKPGTFESVGSTELENAGKAGLVTIQGKISTVLGTILVCAYIFVTFFPEQAEKLFQLAPAG